MSKVLLEADSVTKSFGGTTVLRNVSIDVRHGEVHGLVGENGAGKSTLINIISGVLPMDSGEIRIDGSPVHFDGPSDALQWGVYAVHQELNLVPELSIIDNLFLGQELMGRKKIVTDRKRMKAEANRILSSLEMAEVNPDQKVRSLGMGQKQLVEISKALVRQSRIFILDEPTSSLTNSESDRLFKIVAQLKKEGVAVIFISHKLDEIVAICDRVTVLRDGERIVTKELSEVRIEDIVRWMVGRTLSSYFPPRNAVVGGEALRLEGIGNRRLKEVTLSLHYGEVVGLAGLVGSGRTELARAIFGLDRITKGRILLDGGSVSVASTTDAVRKGIAFITEDRKSEGLIFSMNVEFNTNLAALGFAADGALIRRTRLRRQAEGVVAKLNVKPADIHMLCRNLSGGNQQKVVIGKWLVCNAKIFVFDEPTRGIDVGSKVEVHRLINTLAESGAAILMISSEIEEVIGMSDRVYVMHDGSISAALEKAELTQERLMFAATGQKAADDQLHGVPGA